MYYILRAMLYVQRVIDTALHTVAVGDLQTMGALMEFIYILEV